LVELHIAAFVYAFVDAGEWVALLGGRATPQGREQFRRRLASRPLLRLDRATDLCGLSAPEAASRLRELGAGDDAVFVKEGLQRDELTTVESAVQRTWQSGEAAIVSCLPGRLGLFQDASGHRYLLRVLDDDAGERGSE